jgi:DNA invertase Pin-like site-specific DNA recombinase
MTPRRIEHIVNRYLDGETIRQIARAMRLGRETVRTALIGAGVARRNGELNPPKLEGARLRRALDAYRDADGMTVGEVAARFGISTRGLHRYAARAGIKRLHWKVGHRNVVVNEITEQQVVNGPSCGDE